MKKSKMLWKAGAMLAVMVLAMVFGYDRADAAAIKSGNYTYTTVESGYYPNGTTTIYKQKTGEARKKIIKVSGSAQLECVYNNKLYYTKDIPTDSMYISLWSVDLKTAKKKLVRKNSIVIDHYGKYFVVKANSGDVSPMKYYLLNVNTGKAKLISSNCLAAAVSKTKVYYVEAVSNYIVNEGWKVRLRSCTRTVTGKKTLKTGITTFACYQITPKYMVYRKGNSYYKYTYATKKTKTVQMIFTGNGYIFK